jgi:hypothetical protein
MHEKEDTRGERRDEEKEKKMDTERRVVAVIDDSCLQGAEVTERVLSVFANCTSNAGARRALAEVITFPSVWLLSVRLALAVAITLFPSVWLLSVQPIDPPPPPHLLISLA